AVYVIACQGAPVATASARLLPAVYPGSGYLHWVATDPGHRGRKLGWIVSLRVLYHFRDLGLKDAILETDDFRLPAIKTYLEQGFVPEYTDDSHPERWKRVMEQLSP